MYKYKCSCLKLRYVLRILVYSTVWNKTKTATMFFLYKPFLVISSAVLYLLNNLHIKRCGTHPVIYDSSLYRSLIGYVKRPPLLSMIRDKV